MFSELPQGMKCVLVRQYRHGIGRVVVELPSGAIEASDKNPMEAAKRELLEETGYASNQFIQTGVVSPNPANHSNLTYCFLAKDLKKVREPKLDETEEVETVLVPLEKVVEMFNKGDFLQALHVSSIYFALKQMRSDEPHFPSGRRPYYYS